MRYNNPARGDFSFLFMRNTGVRSVLLFPFSRLFLFMRPFTTPDPPRPQKPPPPSDRYGGMEPSCRRVRAESDDLSSLPTELLYEILTRLDLRDAVRTSALSRAWRRRWESLPPTSLSLLHLVGTPPRVVNGALSRHSGRISRLSVKVHPPSPIGIWDCYDLFILHSSIFSCLHLVSLELQKCKFPPLPKRFAGFPSLVELNLTNVRFPSDAAKQLETIIRRSPLLEVLKLSYVVVGDRNWVIEAPNLLSLTIISEYYQDWHIGELPRLRDFTIDSLCYAGEHDFGKFLAAVAHVGKLTIAAGYRPEYPFVNLLENLSCTFGNLRSMHLLTNFCGKQSMLSTFTLLRNSPNLKDLEIEINYDWEQEIEASAEFQNAQWTDGMCPGLQIVKINGICFWPNEMRFIELLLSKATVLRTMSILGNGYYRSVKSALCVILLNEYWRASAHAQVIFEGYTQVIV